MEEFIQGYCRMINHARTVLLEDQEADCCYPDCDYTAQCPIAQKILALTEQT